MQFTNRSGKMSQQQQKTHTHSNMYIKQIGARQKNILRRMPKLVPQKNQQI